MAVDDDHIFSGFDAYKKVIDSGVDVVILTTPPHFRPEHLKYAIEKGKHAFVEKPIAIDVPRRTLRDGDLRRGEEERTWRSSPDSVGGMRRM